MTSTAEIMRENDLPLLGRDPSVTYRLGIMGGTFDPIHYGHLVAAEQAFDDLRLDFVVFMPAGRPAFKQGMDVSSGEDRYAMTLLATSDNPHFLASRFEVDRDGITKPTLLIILEEALASGIEEIGLVVNPQDEGVFRRFFSPMDDGLKERFSTKAWGLEVSERLAGIGDQRSCLGE